MPKLPDSQDIRNASEKATHAVSEILEQAKTPLLAALGAGDLAAKAVRDLLVKAKETIAERADAAKSSVSGLPAELGDLRQMDGHELRKMLENYTHAAVQLYHYLAEHGKQTLDQLRTPATEAEDAKPAEPAVTAEVDVLGTPARPAANRKKKPAQSADQHDPTA